MSKKDAHKAVHAAVSRGTLLAASKCKCVDCGAQAEHYDHRDYEKPLDVEPVCRKCNNARGPAIGVKWMRERKQWTPKFNNASLKEHVLLYFGSGLKAAKALGISHQAVYGWKDRIPERMAFRVHAKTRGKLKAMPADYQERA